jgi:hypothetical protein
VDAELQDLFATLAYDLDAFRTRLEQPGFLAAYGLPGPESRLLSDAALLEFSSRCLKSLLLD